MYKGIYGTIEKDLLEINFFRNRKKEALERVDLPKAVELYYGVIREFCYVSPRSWRRKRIINVFNTIEDWFILDAAVQYCNANKVLEKDFITAYGYWTAMRMVTRKNLRDGFDDYIKKLVIQHPVMKRLATGDVYHTMPRRMGRRLI